MMISRRNNRPLVRVCHQGCVSKLPDEKHFKKPKKILKESVRIGTWNVRTLYDDPKYKLMKLMSEMERLHINILGIAETHWTKDIEESFEQSNGVIIPFMQKR